MKKNIKKKQPKQQTYSAGQALTNKERIEQNRETINDLMHSSAKNLDSINMLRYQITSVEPLILFQPQQKLVPSVKRKTTVDYTNLKNIGLAYDYILKHKNTKIDSYQIRQIHDILTQGTDCPNGYRIGMVKVFDEFAPSIEKIYYKMNDIEYHLSDKSHSVLTRAFDVHYDIIMTQPFCDFNKRTARMIMNWFLIQNGYRPIVFNKKNDANEYTNALRERVSGNRRAYTEYMEKCMLRTQKEIISILR